MEGKEVNIENDMVIGKELSGRNLEAIIKEVI